MAQAVDDYKRQMSEALTRTEKWGLDPGLEAELLRLYLGRGQPAGVSLTREHLYEFSRNDVVPFEERGGRCLQMHVGVAEHLLKRGFPAPPILTVGDVVVNGSRRYNTTRQGLRSLLRDGRQGRGTIHVHAWLTFPDMTILDMSLLPALLAEHGLRAHSNRPDGMAVAGLPDSLQYTYIPMLVGMDFVWHTASMVPDELRVKAIGNAWRDAGGLTSLRARYESAWEPGQ